METKRLLIGLALAGMFTGQTQTSHATDQILQASTSMGQQLLNAGKTGLLTTAAIAAAVASALILRKAYKKLHYAYIAKNVHLTQKITNKTRLLLDLDDTLLAKTPYGHLVWQHKGDIASCLKDHNAQTFKLWRDGSCSEEWQATLKGLGQEGSKEHAFAHVIQQISQEKTILPGMDTFVQKLHDQGFVIQPLTNMGEKDYKYLEQKYPALFACFTKPVYVTYDAKKARIKKPMPQYFINCKNDHDITQDSIMIDDKRSNCKMAREILGCGSMVVPGDSTNAAFLTTEFRKADVTL